MKMSEIQSRAKVMGIKSTFGVNKTDLIRSIQSAEGNNACFQTGIDNCDQLGCAWREDCQPDCPGEGEFVRPTPTGG